MPSAGKNKGNSGERLIADFLTKLYESKFIRVPNSGAFLGGKNAHRIAQLDQGQIASFKADLIPPSNMRKLVIESKFYGEFPFHKLINNDDVVLLDKWIAQALTSAEPDDFVAVVFRINRRGSFVAYQSKWTQLAVKNHASYKGWIVTDFEEFFTTNKQAIADIVAT